MTTLFEEAIARAQALPPEMQDEIARVVLALTGDNEHPVYQFTPEEAAELDESEAEDARGQYVTDEEVRAI